MTFPAKHTRAIRVDDQDYFWHLNGDWDRKNSWIVVAKNSCEDRQLLFIDPYHHDLLPTPDTVSSAIRFGISQGWDPGTSGEPVRLAYNGDSFEKLPEGMTGWEHHSINKYLR